MIKGFDHDVDILEKWRSVFGMRSLSLDIPSINGSFFKAISDILDNQRVYCTYSLIHVSIPTWRDPPCSMEESSHSMAMVSIAIVIYQRVAHSPSEAENPLAGIQDHGGKDWPCEIHIGEIGKTLHAQFYCLSMWKRLVSL